MLTLTDLALRHSGPAVQGDALLADVCRLTLRMRRTPRLLTPAPPLPLLGPEHQ